MKQRSRQKIDSLEDIIATKGVRYHDPYKRLAFRKSFETLMQEKLSQEKNLRKIDMFSLFDAVAKRGYMETDLEGSKRYRKDIAGER